MADKLAQLYPAHVEELKRRHDRALKEGGFEHAVIYAGAQQMAFLDDNPYPFKVNPHFKAWVPILDNPHCMIVYTPGKKPRLVYYQPVDYWYKPASAPSGYWVDRFDIETIGAPEEAEKHLPRSHVAFLGDPPQEIRKWFLGEVNPKSVIERLHYDRTWKTAYEIECMRQANLIGARGHRAAEKAFRSGGSEYEIHVAYLTATFHAEEELPYHNIIAINDNAAVLHYQNLQRGAGNGRYSFLIDAGGSVNGYASDITRTYSAKKDEFQDLVDAMDRSQQELCAEVRPGVNYPDIHMSAHRKVSKMLADFDFVRLGADAIFETGISRTFFPHGVGHYIGLQVHDVAGFHADPTGKTIPKPENHPYLRLTRKVEENHVFTIEPGLYFIDTLLGELRKSKHANTVNWKKVDDFRKFGGVRVEDDVAVTATGHENLTRKAFAQV